MPDFITDMMNSTFLGVPTIFLIGAIIVIFFLLYTMKGKPKAFKRIPLAREIRNDFDLRYKLSGVPIRKRLKAEGGFVTIGYAIGYFTYKWDKNIPLRARLQYLERIKKAVKQKAEEQDIEEVIVVKMCKNNPISKALALIGMYHYMIIPRTKYRINEKELIIRSGANLDQFFGIEICSQSGKEIIENIAFKLNRANELDEFVNQIPKQNYLELSTAQFTAKARETAAIEKEKYKGQIENA